MADSAADLRARTRATIEAHEREHREQIRKLEKEYRAQMEALRAESDERQAESKRKLAELEKKLEAAIASGQRDIIEKTRKLAEEQRRQLERIDAEAAAAIKRRSEELRKEIDRRYRLVEEEIRKLFETITTQEEREQLWAERSVDKAMGAYRQAQESPAVREFKPQQLNTLQDLYRRLAECSRQRLWASLGSTALALEMECISTLLEAEEELEAWNVRNRLLLERIHQRQQTLASLREECWQFNHWLLSYTCALMAWNEAAFKQVEEQLAGIETALNARSPRCPMPLMSEYSVQIWQESQLLDAALACAHRHVGQFLMIAQLMAGLTEEIPMVSTVWAAEDEAQLEPIANVGSMAFRRCDASYGRLNVSALVHPTPGNGLLLRMEYDGTRSQAQRTQELLKLCTKLAQELCADRYGGIALGNSSVFLDGNIVGINVPVGDMHIPHGVRIGAESMEQPDPTPVPRGTKKGVPEV